MIIIRGRGRGQLSSVCTEVGTDEPVAVDWFVNDGVAERPVPEERLLDTP